MEGDSLEGTDNTPMYNSSFKALRARRLARKERALLAKQAEYQEKTYNVMKNVSTHSMINANDGELDLRLELEDIGV